MSTFLIKKKYITANPTVTFSKINKKTKTRVINYRVNNLDGVIKINSAYEKGTAKVEFDSSKTNAATIEKAINITCYKVTNQK